MNITLKGSTMSLVLAEHFADVIHGQMVDTAWTRWERLKARLETLELLTAKNAKSTKKL